MPKLYNLAKVYSNTAGTGVVTLGSPVPGYVNFASAGVQNGDIVSYGIRDGVNTEVGVGVYSSTGPTLTRVTVSVSTNSNNKINLSGLATTEVYISPRAEDVDVEGSVGLIIALS